MEGVKVMDLECLDSTPWKGTSVLSDCAGTKQHSYPKNVIHGEFNLYCPVCFAWEGLKSKEGHVRVMLESLSLFLSSFPP